jgi:hypothetical protein
LWVISRHGGAISYTLNFTIKQGDGGFNMQRLALGLALTSASLFACAATTLLPSRVLAFETEPGAITVLGGATQFQDPDEKSLPAPLSSPKLEEDGTNLQMAPETSSPGASLQLAPGTSLQRTAGQEAGLQMAPTIDSGNPADDRTLIPSP